MSASYERKASEKLLEMFALFPPVPEAWGNRAVTTRFHVLNSLKSCVLFKQTVDESYHDRPSEGITAFPDGFKSGTINADGRVTEVTDLFHCRLIMMHYHGGWYITVVDDVNALKPIPNPAEWAKRIARLQDDRMREDMTVAFANLMLGITRIEDHYAYLNMAHDCHSRQHIGFKDKSIQFA
ncbi:hypothetical protein [Xanthomonas phage RTH11]|nr:hypothetical protein [Xanthomonas phage RTH11]